jgi:SAM-dependent methyltransferase
MTPTHPAVAGFDRVGDAYERGRPSYPTAAIDLMVRELGLGPGSRVIELGAGTGKFTRALGPCGAAIVPIEPSRGMRTVLHRLEPDRPVLAAKAEQLPLRAGTADAVVAAQAFHWFASAETVAEILRVLRPGGGIGLIWNVRDESLPWTAKLGAMINAHEVGTPNYKHVEWQRVFDGHPELTQIRHQRFEFSQPLDPETLVDRVLSVSFIALLPEPERETLATEVRELLATAPATRGRAVVDLPYRTDVYLVHRRPPEAGDHRAP